MKLTCICPIWGRPQRTIRAIECVVNQQFTEYEALFIGDGCPIFQENLDNHVFDKYIKEAKEKGGELTFINLQEHRGGWGCMARKYAIEIAKGDYILFLDNDDIILPNHFSNYYSFIESNKHIDVGYTDTILGSGNNRRIARLSADKIGHAEIIVKADVLKKEYFVNFQYGHDWSLIYRMIRNRYKFAKSRNNPTYIVKSYCDTRERGID